MGRRRPSDNSVRTGPRSADLFAREDAAAKAQARFLVTRQESGWVPTVGVDQEIEARGDRMLNEFVRIRNALGTSVLL